MATPVNTVLTNFAQILSSQDDANPADNTSTCQTKVTAGCTNMVVNTPPADQTVCPGDTAVFSETASGTGLSYQWYQGSNILPGKIGSMLGLTNVTALDAGTYKVIITDLCGDTVTNSATLTVNSNTLVTVPPVNSTNCPGTTANFSVTATGTGLGYQWYHGATMLPGQIGNSLTITNVSAASAGTYNVVITGACNSVTNGAMLVVNSPTSVTAPPMNSTNCPGTTAYFSVTATGTVLAYQWYHGVTLLSGQIGNTLAITNLSAANGGMYSVVITGACGSTITNSAMLVINSPTLVTIPPMNSTNCPGTTANFSVSATGTSLMYQWYQGMKLLPGQIGNTLAITNVSAANAGIYNVVITGACGSSITNSAMLVVNAITSVTNSPSDVTSCPGGTVNFSVNATGTGLSYQWYAGTNLLANETNSTLTLTNVSEANAGAYSVVVSGECGSPITNSAVLTVNTSLTVSTPPADQTVCPGGTAIFSVSASGTGLTYQWYKGNNPLAAQTNSTLTLTNVDSSYAGPYSVMMASACGNPVTKSAALTVNTNVLVVTPPANSTNCPGATAIFSVNAIGTGVAYQWYQGANLMPGEIANTLTLTNVSAANAGMYSVVVTGTCGGSITNSAVLVVNADTMVTIPPMNSTNCPGTTANFSVTATGTDLTYLWFRGPAVFLGTNSSISIANVGAANAGVYTVVVTGACGKSITNSATLVVNTTTLVTMPPANSTNCPGTTAYFSVNAVGTDLTYQWYQGANLLPGQIGSVLALTNVSAGSAGAYYVVVSGDCGNPITNHAVLVVNENVSVAPLANVTNIIGSSAIFTAVASGTGPFSYQWFQGANALAGQTNSTLTLNNLQPTNGGPYSVSVTGQCGHAAAAGFILTIDLPPIVSITYPTNGQVFIDPATFNVMASASDPDGTVTNVQFLSSSNGTDFVFLGQTNNMPYLTIASNLPAGSYTFIATATDNLGSTAQSQPVTVQVVPTEVPTVTVLGNLTLNLQDGYQWLSNVVCNPVNSHALAARVYIHNITNNAIKVVNASGTNNGLPYVQSPGAIQPGTCWTNVIKFYDPVQAAFYPILSVELVPVANAAGSPAGVTVPMLPPKTMRNGTFMVEFASSNGATYYMQYSSDMQKWDTSFPAITGTGQHMQWIDSGPPATSSLPAANVQRFYRVIQAQ
jgi:hypothetical protein